MHITIKKYTLKKKDCLSYFVKKYFDFLQNTFHAVLSNHFFVKFTSSFLFVCIYI